MSESFYVEIPHCWKSHGSFHVLSVYRLAAVMWKVLYAPEIQIVDALAFIFVYRTRANLLSRMLVCVQVIENTRRVSFDIKFTRQVFENAC